MSEQSIRIKMAAFLALIPVWLWIAALGSFLLFSGFLYYISNQTPDQYAMTTRPPWQHTMNHNELIAYHRALKSGHYLGSELDAKQFLYRQGTSEQLYAQQFNPNTSRPQALQQQAARKPLTIEQITGFASRSTPVNNDSFRQAQQYVSLERNRQGFIDTTQIANNIPSGIYVQTASFRSMQDATQLRETLKMRGYAPFVQQAFIQNQTWYRVRFGPFQTMSDARQAAQSLKANNYSAQVIQH